MLLCLTSDSYISPYQTKSSIHFISYVHLEELFSNHLLDTSPQRPNPYLGPPCPSCTKNPSSRVCNATSHNNSKSNPHFPAPKSNQAPDTNTKSSCPLKKGSLLGTKASLPIPAHSPPVVHQTSGSAKGTATATRSKAPSQNPPQPLEFSGRLGSFRIRLFFFLIFKSCLQEREVEETRMST